MTTDYIDLVGAFKVRVSAQGVAAFNRWCTQSSLRATRSYWFEFDADQVCIDTDMPEQDDCLEAAHLVEQCRAWLFDDKVPWWAE